MTITVREIADRIWRPNGKLTKAKVIDRLRNWTKEGLLVPTGEKNPGTGRHRRYPEAAVADALLLTVLTDAIGLQATKARSFAEVFQLAKKWLASGADTDQSLIIGLSLGGEPTETKVVWSRTLQNELKTSSHPVHIVIDLHKVYFNVAVPGA